MIRHDFLSAYRQVFDLHSPPDLEVWKHVEYLYDHDEGSLAILIPSMLYVWYLYPSSILDINKSELLSFLNIGVSRRHLNQRLFKAVGLDQAKVVFMVSIIEEISRFDRSVYDFEFRCVIESWRKCRASD